MSETGGLIRESPSAPRVRVSLGSVIPRSLRGTVAGIGAIAAKELRGRMRGRRAFLILTVYLGLLVAFGWMIELTQEKAASGLAGAGPINDQSARIGQAIFIGLLALETLLVLFLAPAFTAGAISMEREKQTLDLLATTPVSSLSIVLGKLLSALTYVFLLIGASVPLTAIVFVFGGVGPEDVLRGYAVLIVEAIGLGSVGLFWSAVMRRTQAAIVATYFTVLAMTLGATFVFWFLESVRDRSVDPAFDLDANGVVRVQAVNAPPAALLWFNPFVADADVICPIDVPTGQWCRYLSYATGRALIGNPIPALRGISVPAMPQALPGLVPEDGTDDPGAILKRRIAMQPLDKPLVVAPDLVAGGAGGLENQRDTFWPHSALAWIVLSTILTGLSVRLVSPAHRRRAWFRRTLGRRRLVPE